MRQIGLTEIGNIKDWQGLSSETKPVTDLGSGSTFYELDTGKLWLYDADNTNPVTTTGWWEI